VLLKLFDRAVVRRENIAASRPVPDAHDSFEGKTA